MKERIEIIGLTGCIGSGKTTAAARFSFLGASVLDADHISRSLLDSDGDCYDAVIRAFGKGIVREDGAIDRKMVAQIVFSDPEKRETLESIVHPAVIVRLFQQATAIRSLHPDRLVVLDVPLLFECGMEKSVDLTVLVEADEGTRLARVLARGGIAEADARARMAAQMPQQEKRKLADVCIDNNGSQEALFLQIDVLYARLKDALPV